SGIEPRVGNYTVVFRFAATLTSVDDVNVSSTGGGSSPTVTSSGIGADRHEFIVNLSNVPNAQRTGVTLTDVTDSMGHNATSITGTMGVLLGDVNGNRLVNSTDT